MTFFQKEGRRGENFVARLPAGSRMHKVFDCQECRGISLEKNSPLRKRGEKKEKTRLEKLRLDSALGRGEKKLSKDLPRIGTLLLGKDGTDLLPE